MVKELCLIVFLSADCINAVTSVMSVLSVIDLKAGFFLAL